MTIPTNYYYYYYVLATHLRGLRGYIYIEEDERIYIYTYRHKGGRKEEMGGIRTIKKMDDDTIIEYIENWSVDPSRVRIKIYKLKWDLGDHEI